MGDVVEHSRCTRVVDHVFNTVFSVGVNAETITVSYFVGPESFFESHHQLCTVGGGGIELSRDNKLKPPRIFNIAS